MLQNLYLGGGCFWGLQKYFDLLDGVVSTQVGYANSTLQNPSYKEVCSGSTNAVETVSVVFEDNIISLEEILYRFFAVVDPTALNYQGNDRGTQYRNGIYSNDTKLLKKVQTFIQKHIAPNYKQPIVTEVQPLQNFYKAEEYHQSYLDKNPFGYCHINVLEALKPLDLKTIGKKHKNNPIN